MMVKKVCWFVFFIALMVSCLDNPDCFNLNNNYIQLSFRKMIGGGADTVYIERMTVEGLDSPIVERALVVGNIQIPVNYLSDRVTVHLTREEGGETKTYVFGYDSQPQYVSEDCGERFVLSKLNVLESPEGDPEAGIFRDSLRLINDTPTPPGSQAINVGIYSCPRLNELRLAFRQLYPDTVRLGRALSVGLESIQDVAAGVLYNVSDTIAALGVPLNTDVDDVLTTWTFNFTDGTQSTLDISYRVTDNQQRLFYDYCGVLRHVSQLAIDGSDFDDVILRSDTVTDPPSTNFFILKCPDSSFTNQMRVDFRNSIAQSAISTPLSITEIRADFLDSAVFRGGRVSNITLPLNPNADATTYTFTLQDEVMRQLQVAYSVEEVSIQNDRCLVNRYNDLRVTSTDFPVGIEGTRVAADSVYYPVVSNIVIANPQN